MEQARRKTQLLHKSATCESDERFRHKQEQGRDARLTRTHCETVVQARRWRNKEVTACNEQSHDKEF
jgi:hypothetical protein